MAGCTLPTLLLAASIGLTWACSQPENWQTKSLEERAMSPLWVVYGTVMSSQMPLPDRVDNGTDQEYQVLFQPLCWLKKGMAKGSDDGPETSDDGEHRAGDDDDNDDDNDDDRDMMTNSTFGDIGFQNITVTEIKIDCVANELQNGEEYVLFLERFGKEMFTIIDVNVESGVIANPEDATFEEVHRGIDAGMNGNPEGKCQPGVEIACFTGTKDNEVCSKAVNMGVAAWLVIAAAIMAALGF